MTTVSAAGPANRTAKVLTELFAPWVWCLSLPFAVAFTLPGSLLSAVAWGALVALGAAIIPMAAILHRMKTGKVNSGHHVTTRAERYIPLAVALFSVATLLVILVLAQAPAQMVAVTAVMLISVAVCLAITRVWKISLHSAVSAGSVVVLTIEYGPAALWLSAAAAAVCWSRVKLGDHSWAQVVAGCLAGITIGMLFIPMV
jgi:membrane-associated phospholipid phosphatase